MADTLLQIDNRLADSVVFIMGSSNPVTIKFQFPPKILNDSRTGSWFETEIPGNQPIATWKTSGARKWSLEWTYVIGARGWDTKSVRDQIINLRNYWTARENLASNFIVNFWIWKLGGPDKMTCRLTNIDVTHGKALYIPNGNIELAHPVITNIKVAMQLWTLGGSDYAEAVQTTAGQQQTLTNKLTGSKTNPKEAKMDVPGIAARVLTGWQ